MPSDSISPRNRVEHLNARRQPNLKFLTDSNRQPDGSEQIPVAQRRSIITVGQSSCRWPIGDPQQKGFYLCGGHTSDQHSYCPHHMRMAYVPASRSKRVA